MNSTIKWNGGKKKSNSIRHDKVNDKFFHITFILLGIYPRDNSLHSNMVSSKLVPKTPIKMWIGRKLSLSHILIWVVPLIY